MRRLQIVVQPFIKASRQMIWLGILILLGGAIRGARRRNCALYRHEIHFPMIKGFRHRGLERFFRTGSKAGIQPKHAKRLRLQLGQLDAARPRP
jgi:hypothetical protein